MSAVSLFLIIALGSKEHQQPVTP